MISCSLRGGGAAAGCIYSDNTYNFESWQDYRLENDNAVTAYIYNASTKNGEFFIYSGENDTGSEYSIQRAVGSSWNYDFPVGSSRVYIVEEWLFYLEDETLKLIIDDDTQEPLNVAFGMSDFQVQAILNDDTELDSFDQFSDWTQLKAVRISLTGQDTFRGETMERTLTAQFFPRNVLSN